MHAKRLIRELALERHSEGGWYREVHRSGVRLPLPPGYSGDRCALTAIHFLLERGDVSVFHRVRSEEVWVHLAGDPLELFTLDGTAEHSLLGPVDRGHEPFCAVGPDVLQASAPTGEFALAGCFVAPGFDFEDFEIVSRAELLVDYPYEAELIRRFTRPEGPNEDTA